MAHLMSRSVQGRNAFKASRPRPAASRAPVAARRAQRSGTVRVEAFFNFLAPKAGAAVSPKAQELSDALLEVVSQTKPGSPVSPVAKAEVEELVSQLQPLGVKNPVRSPLLWGTYDVIYCSKPAAVGGPLTQGAGPVVAAGQQARQILEAPGTLVNEVSFKTLGLLPGFSRQYGQIKPVSGDTFVLSIKEGEISTGFGKQSKDFDIERKIQILYLDDNLRIARFLPSELVDSESEEGEGGAEQEEILFVFQRVAEQEEEEEVEEEVLEEEEEEERPASPVLNLFGGTRKVESLATQAERKVQEQRTRKGTQPVQKGGAGGTQPVKRGTQPFFIGGRGREAEEEERDDPRAARARQQAEAAAKRAREQEERKAAQEKAKQEAAAARAAEQAKAAKERERAEREKEAERARLQREKEAEARARAQQEARERAEAEKVARAERQAKIRELLAELGEELKEKQAATREATKDAREVARENQAVLKQVAAAEAAIAEAERDVQKVSAALDEAVAARKGVEQQFKSAQQAVRDAESAYRQKVAAR